MINSKVEILDDTLLQEQISLTCLFLRLGTGGQEAADSGK
jgi:hypothetical protein